MFTSGVSAFFVVIGLMVSLPVAFSAVLTAGEPYAVECENLIKNDLSYVPEFRFKQTHATETKLLYVGNQPRPDNDRWIVKTIPGGGKSLTFSYQLDSAEFYDSGEYACLNGVEWTTNLTVTEKRPTCTFDNTTLRAGSSLAGRCELSKRGPEEVALNWLRDGVSVEGNDIPSISSDHVKLDLLVRLDHFNNGNTFSCMATLGWREIQCDSGPIQVTFEPFIIGQPKTWGSGGIFHGEFHLVGNPLPSKKSLSIFPEPEELDILKNEDGSLNVTFYLARDMRNKYVLVTYQLSDETEDIELALIPVDLEFAPDDALLNVASNFLILIPLLLTIVTSIV